MEEGALCLKFAYKESTVVPNKGRLGGRSGLARWENAEWAAQLSEV